MKALKAMIALTGVCCSLTDSGCVQTAVPMFSSAVAVAAEEHTARYHATDLLKPAVCQTSNLSCACGLIIAAGLAHAVTDMIVEALITPTHGAEHI
jgi:hypothetical protein